MVRTQINASPHILPHVLAREKKEIILKFNEGVWVLLFSLREIDAPLKYREKLSDQNPYANEDQISSSDYFFQ